MTLPKARKTISVIFSVIAFPATLPPCNPAKSFFVNVANTERYPEQLLCIRTKMF